MTAGNGKPCKKCGTSDWYPAGGCKECGKVRGRKWLKDNIDKHRERCRRWRQENIDMEKERVLRWHRENRCHSRENSSRWRKENQDKFKTLISKWGQENPDKRKAYYHKRKTKKSKAGGSFTGQEWKQLCKQYNDRCLKCGKEGELTVDHIIPVSMGGTSDISNIQPLCRSCNSSKGATYKDYRNKPAIERKD